MKNIVLLPLVSFFLLSAMVVTSVVAQERTVGVSVGDWFKYGGLNVWIVPEFPTWMSTILMLIVLTVAIAIYKRRSLKTLIC